MRAWLLSSILLVTTIAGCLGSDESTVPDAALHTPLSVEGVLELVSEPLGAVEVIHEELGIETRHGMLRADVYRGDPATYPADWKSPVIVIASPYNNPSKDRNDDNRVRSDLYDWLENFLVPRGYAIVHLDTLGTRESTGCTTVMDSTEREATAEAIDALGKMDWSNGKVGMIGKSYVGATQVGAAIEEPEHLVTIVPVSPVSNAYAYHYRNGVPYAGNQLTNVLYATNANAVYRVTQTPYGTAPEQAIEDPAAFTEGPVCFPESIAMGALPTGDYTERWADRDMRPGIPEQRSDISVLFIHGHQDWNVKPDHFTDVWNSYPSDVKLAMLGQWHHDYPDNNRWDPDTHGHREDWYWLLHRWFDHFLMDIDTGLAQEIATCPVQTQGSDAVWRCMESFPQDADELTLYPAGTELAPELGSGSATYIEPGSGPATTTGDDPGGPTMLTYRHTFEEDTRVVGIPNITLTASTTSPYNAHLIAVLALERAGGGVDELTWAIQSLRHRNGLTGEPIVPATEYAVTFDFFMMDHVFEEGDTLQLIVRGTSMAPNLGIVPNPVPGAVTIDEAGSALRLPVLSTGNVFEPLGKDDVPKAYNPQLDG